MDEQFPEIIPAPESHIWATKVPHRSPEFKVHRTEGLANAAMGNRPVYESFAKYKLVEGEWVRVYFYKPPDQCQRCGNTLVVENRWGRTYASRNRDRTHKGPKFEAPIVCDSCDARDYAAKNKAATERRERAELARLKAQYEA